MSRSSLFESRPDPVTLGGGSREGETDLGKHLEERDRDETWWEKYSQVLDND